MGVLFFAGLQAVAVTVVESPPASDEADRSYPGKIATTWVYASRSNGEQAGTHVAQVLCRGSTTSGASTVIESRWDNLLGAGSSREVVYFAERGSQLLLHGRRVGSTFTNYDPPWPQWPRGRGVGKSFTWNGTYGVEERRVTTTLEGREDIVAGASQRGCEHYRSRILVAKEAADVERTSEEWRCPGIGAVRTVESAPRWVIENFPTTFLIKYLTLAIFAAVFLVGLVLYLRPRPTRRSPR